MSLRVVGAGVGRTGTTSLKAALEQLLRGRCHHMSEMFDDERQVAGWTAACRGEPVDWSELLADYVAQVDWPGASFWPELTAANPDALVVLSVRDPDAWYTSASNTIFGAMSRGDEEVGPWIAAVRRMLGQRFSDRFSDRDAMIEAYERHNDAVRRGVPGDRLLEWTTADGWPPICQRLGVPIPDGEFPWVNTTEDFQAMVAALADGAASGDDEVGR